jgi:sugar/nucleoside kinase (ribokinase family)
MREDFAMRTQSYDIVVVGHISKDIVVYLGEEEHLTGGAVFYASVAASRSGASVLAVTKTSPQDRGLIEPLLEEGLQVLNLNSPDTTSIRNVYLSEDRERRKISLLAVASPFRLEELPTVKTRIVYFAGLLRGELPDELIQPLSERAEVALDVQGVLRRQRGERLVFEDWVDKERFLPRITYLKTDAAEAQIMTGEADREKAAAILKQMGAREVMVTHHTEVLVAAEGRIYRTPFTPKNLSGRTGRGDTCFSSYLAWRLSHGIQESVDYAAALTSIKMESPGPFRGTREDVSKRMKKRGLSGR